MVKGLRLVDDLNLGTGVSIHFARQEFPLVALDGLIELFLAQLVVRKSQHIGSTGFFCEISRCLELIFDL